MGSNRVQSARARCSQSAIPRAYELMRIRRPDPGKLGGMHQSDGLCAIPNAEFREDRVDVGLHRCDADKEPGGDFRVAESVADESEDLVLAGSEVELGVQAPGLG